jgi:hypothetical protein
MSVPWWFKGNLEAETAGESSFRSPSALCQSKLVERCLLHSAIHIKNSHVPLGNYLALYTCTMCAKYCGECPPSMAPGVSPFTSHGEQLSSCMRFPTSTFAVHTSTATPADVIESITNLDSHLCDWKLEICP